MNLDRRLGNQDADAATLFAAARSFRPSARGRRRALRALGLPIGLSLFGSGLAHAASLLASSIKGWGLVAGVVATVGAAGGVTYVVTAAPSVPPSSVSDRGLAKKVPSSGFPAPPRAFEVPEVSRVPEVAPQVPAGPAVQADPAPARADFTGAVEPPLPSTPLPVSARRLATRAQAPALPSPPLGGNGDRSSPVPLLAERGEPPMLPTSPAPFPAPLPLPVPAVASPSSSLNGELALVTDAQARLRAGDARGALVALELHGRLYPNAVLAEEAELLRLRAFIARGDRHRARQAGEGFLRRHPASPLEARIRSLMNTLDGPGRP